MPRLSLYRPEKTKDYEFIDRIIYEQFSVGGTDLHIYKYLGPKNPTEGAATPSTPAYDTNSPFNIQDFVFLENRDRKYDTDVYKVRAVYNVSNNDFNLSQFGLFLSNDILYVTIHINSSVKTIGRKVIAGDVVELPHLEDEYALNDYSVALKRFYVVEEVTRASEGYSQTWYPHLYRLKLKQITASQEYEDILSIPIGEGTTETLGDILSTYETDMKINNAIIGQAEADAKLSGYDTSHFYTLQVDEDGNPELITVDMSTIDASSSLMVDRISMSPDRSGYCGYLLGDGLAPNGEYFGVGGEFPTSGTEGDYILRTDFMPNRLYRFDGLRWAKIEDNVRHTLTNTSDRQTQKTSFINNTTVNTIGGEQVEERQSLSKALRPKADN
jgi:hypothetical protein